MQQNKIAIVGIGATGTVLAAALLSKYPDTVLVGTARIGRSHSMSSFLLGLLRVAVTCSVSGAANHVSIGRTTRTTVPGSATEARRANQAPLPHGPPGHRRKPG